MNRAGLWRRLAALVYDGLLLSGVLFAATVVLLPVTGGEAIAPGNPLFMGYLVAMVFLFYGWCWTHGGQTLGMKAWRLRVRDRDGGRLTWSRSALRFVTALLSWLPLGLGYLWLLFDPEHLAWHDRLSGTEVILLPKPS